MTPGDIEELNDLHATIARLTRERDALSAWQCQSCGARFGANLGPAAASALDGVTRCSRCVEVEVLTAQRDEALDELARWKDSDERLFLVRAIEGENNRLRALLVDIRQWRNQIPSWHDGLPEDLSARIDLALEGRDG